MPSVVFCDNSDCHLYDGCYGECDAEKLVVRRGVCAGSTVLGRNVSENDLDEQLRVENEKLKAENKRLTRELEAEHALAECLGHSHEAAKSENEKLRKLAKSAWGCVNRHISCDACRITCGGCTLQSAMRELGVE